MLTIGGFARYAGVSVRMLRHYDTLGLLVPTEVDEFTGYRRYDAALLPRAHRLVALRSLGFSLEECAGLLDAPDDAAIVPLLRQRRDDLQTSIAADNARLAEIEDASESSRECTPCTKRSR